MLWQLLQVAQWSVDVTAVVSGVIGALLGAGGITPVIAQIYKSRRESTNTQNRFAAATFDRMERRIEALEEAERECQDAKEQLIKELGDVRAELHGVSTRVAMMQQEAIVGRVQCDATGKVTAFSSGAERLFGWHADEVIGRDVTVLMPAHCRGVHHVALRAAVAEVTRTNTLPKPAARDVPILHKGGRTSAATVVVHSYRAEDGAVVFDAEVRPRDAAVVPETKGGE